MTLQMRDDAAYISTPEAAGLLGIDVRTLRRWEQRYGFPTPTQGAPGERRVVSRHEVLALRNALRAELSIHAAIALARG